MHSVGAGGQCDGCRRGALSHALLLHMDGVGPAPPRSRTDPRGAREWSAAASAVCCCTHMLPGTTSCCWNGLGGAVMQGQGCLAPLRRRWRATPPRHRAPLSHHSWDSPAQPPCHTPSPCCSAEAMAAGQQDAPSQSSGEQTCMRWGSAPRAPSRPTRRMHTTSQPVTAHHLHAQFVNQHQSLLSPHAHKGWGSMFSVGGQLSKDAKLLKTLENPNLPTVHKPSTPP